MNMSSLAEAETRFGSAFCVQSAACRRYCRCAGLWVDLEGACSPRCRFIALSHGFETKGLANVNPFKFVQEVRQEVAKVTWPTRNETWVTTIAVLIMVTLASIFFMLADQAMGWLVSLILGIGR